MIVGQVQRKQKSICSFLFEKDIMHLNTEMRKKKKNFALGSQLSSPLRYLKSEQHRIILLSSANATVVL